jgi:hypothetical protein
MVEWLKDHMAVVGYFNTQYFGVLNGTGLNWRLGGALRWKVETACWNGRGVICDKPAPPRL